MVTVLDFVTHIILNHGTNRAVETQTGILEAAEKSSKKSCSIVVQNAGKDANLDGSMFSKINIFKSIFQGF